MVGWTRAGGYVHVFFFFLNAIKLGSPTFLLIVDLQTDYTHDPDGRKKKFEYEAKGKRIDARGEKLGRGGQLAN